MIESVTLRLVVQKSLDSTLPLRSSKPDPDPYLSILMYPLSDEERTTTPDYFLLDTITRLSTGPDLDFSTLYDTYTLTSLADADNARTGQDDFQFLLETITLLVEPLAPYDLETAS